MQGLMKLSKKYPFIDVRGRGLMVAAEFGSEDGGMTAAAGTASKVTKACAARNLLLLSAGAHRPHWLASPLLVVKSEYMVESAPCLLGHIKSRVPAVLDDSHLELAW